MEPRLFSLLVFLGSISLVSACGDDGRPTDGGADADAGVDARVMGIDPPMPPAEPTAPASPSFTPCRPGWNEVEGTDGLTVCEPYDGPTPTSCPPGEAPFPGEGCARVGDACPAGEFPEGLPATGVIYVRRGSAGGNGTLERPFGRILLGVDAADAGDTVALAKGTYNEEVYLTDFEDVNIVGACPEETIWEPGSANLGFGTFEVARGRATLKNITFRGPRQAVRFEGATASGELESVIIEGAPVVGLGVYTGAVVTGRSLVIRDTTPHPDGVGGRAIGIEGGDVTVTRAVFENNHSEALTALGEGSVARLSDTLVRGTRESDGFAEGLTSAIGGRLEAEGMVIEGNAQVGVLTIMDATTVLRDSIVRGNGTKGMEITFGSEVTLERVRFDDNGATAVQTQEGATLTADDVLVSRSGDRGFVSGMGSTVTVRRAHVAGSVGTAFLALSGDEARIATLTVEDIYARDTGTALQIQEGARGIARRLRSERALSSAAIVIRGEGVLFEGEDLDLSEIQRLPDPEDIVGDRARGVEIRVGAEAVIDRLRVVDAFQLGVFVEGATATLRDVIVTGTTARDDIIPGYGRAVEGQDSTLVLERAHLERNLGAGLSIGGGTTTVTDLMVIDTRGSGQLRASGKGVVANQGAQVDLDRVTLVQSREVGIAAFESGTRISATNLVVLDTLERDCIVDVCPDNGAGIGVGAYLSSHLVLTRFAIGRSALVGLQLAGGTAEAGDGQITDNPVGVNLQTEGVDFAALTTNVTFENNERNVDTAMIPLPDALDPLAGE